MSMNSGDPTAPKSRHGTSPPRPAFWVTPDWYGTYEALSSTGTIAAPLLGGFALASVVLTLSLTPSDLRWPDAAFLLFLLAALFFVGTVQATFWARQYQASPSEIKSWWEDAETANRLILLSGNRKCTPLDSAPGPIGLASPMPSPSSACLRDLPCWRYHQSLGMSQCCGG
jgi:hypothetical protein